MDAEQYRLRDFLTRTAQPYEWHEAGSADADPLLEKLGLEGAALPVLMTIAEKVAQAHKEGGEKISGKERAALDDIAATLAS